jgi:hypothetical protein
MLRKSKYPNDFSKKAAIRLLRIFRKSRVKDYTFNVNNPSELEFRVYVPVITQNRDIDNNEQVLARLLSFSQAYDSIIRIYVDGSRLCVEIRIKR